ncbi:hypothetical protein BJ875DRAFT_461563 [Amylocarpus encephaloides]|uniref:Myb-like domain-containing protein n=1 Tax=Amylocarpus encephaloides TaxID=45428 RepID=A0A9P7YIY5_9HELO|nr:hypothetical protein BJ875DRAFT_461563 [Amylocarpus encephaloides]
MLKGRSKVFAPKLKGGIRRPSTTPASTQSSARPNVEPQQNTERQSQTQAPETATNISKSTASQVQSEHPSTVPQVESNPLAAQQNQPITRDTPTAPEHARSPSTASNDNSVAFQTLPSAQVKSAETTGIPTSQLSNQNATSQHPSSPSAKRKTRGEDVPTEPLAKRVYLAEGVAGLERSSTIAGRASQTTNEILRDHNTAECVSSETTPGLTIPGQGLQTPQSTPQNQDGVPRPVKNLATTERDDGPSRSGDDASEYTPEEPRRARSPARMRYPTPPGTHSIASPTPGLGAAGGDAGLGAAGDENVLMEPGQLGEGSRIVPMAGLNPDGTAAGIEEAAPSGREKEKKKKKVIIRRKKVQSGQDGDDARATVDMQLNRPRRVAGLKRKRKRNPNDKRSRKRAPTPDGAEDEIVDQTTMKMSDLCKDLRIGKKFSKHDMIKERIIKQRARAKLGMDQNEGEPDENALAPAPVALEPALDAEINIGGGPHIRLVDGQFVSDELSLQVDRQARVRANQETLEIVEEDDFTRVITSNSFNKKILKAQPWDETDTEKFYKGLKMFGTDFEMIAKLFPNRNRKQVKLKFNKEERVDGARVSRTMIGEKDPINLEEYETLSGMKLEDLEAIEGERAAIQEQHDAEQAQFAKEKADAEAAKRAEIQSKSGGASAASRILASYDDDSPGASKGKGKKKAAAAKKKNMHSSSRFDEGYEVLASIEVD